MSERPSGGGAQEPPRTLPSLEPTHPAWFSHQAGMALLTRYTTIHGYSALLQRVVERQPLDLARTTKYTHRLIGEVQELGRLLEQYLEAVQLQAGVVTLMRRPVDVNELFETVQDECARLPECTDQHVLDIESARAVIGHWDPHWVVPALSAVVSNAMKFTPDGGTITVRIQREGDSAIVTVHDPGLGIRDDERELVRLPFVRGSAARGTFPGWGLGLYIADQAVHAHGGALDLSSSSPGGTTVTIRLPLHDEPVA